MASDGTCHTTLWYGLSFRRSAANHPLRTMRPMETLTMGVMTHEDIGHLVRSMADGLPTDVVELVCRLAHGSPFMAAAAVRGMVESGALSLTPQGWVLDSAKRSEWQSSEDSATLLSRRIDFWGHANIRVLALAALLGKEFESRSAGDSSRTRRERRDPRLGRSATTALYLAALGRVSICVCP